jgi:tRNA-splicing ligase RtcB
MELPPVRLEQIDPYRWRIPKAGPMHVDGIVYATEKLMESIREDQSLQQVANVATLPGIVKASIAMPDIHWGYGFPIGGVAAFDLERGVISPGGVGYDINCGVRLLRSDITRKQAEQKKKELVETLFSRVPTGVGAHRKELKLSREEMKQVAQKGAAWALTKGFGEQADIAHIEEEGCIPQADPDLVSDRAYERGRDQLGTLGSGNHFAEVGYVEEIYDESIAQALGLAPDFVTVIIHCGSRGFGHQICTDYLEVMARAAQKFGIDLPDRQLACAPLSSEEGQHYLAAMACGANFAFCNRQIITHYVRETFEEVFGIGPKEHGLRVVYDVCHNIAKIEEHVVDGKRQKVCMHRKGATRALPPGHPLTPEAYKDTGQPVLIPGDMGRYSYVLVGTEGALKETFGSCCHGAGRVMSRHEAKRRARGRSIVDELKKQGILIRADGMATIVEEMPEAYKDVSLVVEAVHAAGIGKMVARLKPLCVIKG